MYLLLSFKLPYSFSFTLFPFRSHTYTPFHLLFPYRIHFIRIDSFVCLFACVLNFMIELPHFKYSTFWIYAELNRTVLLILLLFRWLNSMLWLLLFFSLHFSQVDVLDKLNLLWKFVKPISFALIGKEVLFSKLDAQLVGYGVLIVIIGSLVSDFQKKKNFSIAKFLCKTTIWFEIFSSFVFNIFRDFSSL